MYAVYLQCYPSLIPDPRALAGVQGSQCSNNMAVYNYIFRSYFYAPNYVSVAGDASKLRIVGNTQYI